MADLNSLEKQIQELVQATTEGFKATNQQLGAHAERFDLLEKQIQDLTQTTITSFKVSTERSDGLEKQIEVLAQATSKGFDSVHTEIGEIKEELGVVNQKLERIERRLDEHGELVLSIDTRVAQLEKTEEPAM